MGLLPRAAQRRRRRLENAERNVMLMMWVWTIPAGWQAIRFYRNGGGQVDPGGRS